MVGVVLGRHSICVFHSKTTGLQPAAHLGGLESEPQIGQLAQALIFVSCQVDDGQFTSRTQGTPGLLQSDGGGRNVVQNHTCHDRVGLAVAHRQMLEVAESKFAPTDLRASRDPGEVQHRRRRIDCDHPVGALQQRRQEQSGAGTQIENRLTAFRQQRQRHLAVVGPLK